LLLPPTPPPTRLSTPPHPYRLDLDGDLPEETEAPFLIRPLERTADAIGVNRCYAQRHMVEVETEFFLSRRGDERYLHLVACDRSSGEILGTVTGLDHLAVFGDPEGGSSLWCLAVDSQAPYPGIGAALVHDLARRLQARGRAFVDLSVLYDNSEDRKSTRLN